MTAWWRRVRQRGPHIAQSKGTRRQGHRARAHADKARQGPAARASQHGESSGAKGGQTRC
eukprot:1344323-Rhodomonas_salina.1